jgi:chorismate mutase
MRRNERGARKEEGLREAKRDPGAMNVPTEGPRLWGLRGAVQSERNDPEAIVGATKDLLAELMGRNELEPEAFVSVIFTCTADLDAEFPAVAAREVGFGQVPLLCNREIDVPGAMERVIRLLAHYYGPAERPPEHVYLGETRRLRADLHSAQ